MATVAAALAVSAGCLGAQGRSLPDSWRGPRAEWRLDVVAGTRTTGQIGAGFNVPAGAYTRLGIDLAVGATRHEGATVATGRLDGVARFLLDPFRESPVGVYGIAGASLIHDGDRWEPRLLVGVGLEGRPRGRLIPAGEVALGGGVRVGLVLRRSRRDRR